MSSFDLGIDPPTAPQVGGASLDDDAGAGYEPADAFDSPPMLEEHLEAPEVGEEDMRRAVRHIGTSLNRRHHPDLPEQWLVLPSEEDGIAPPLTRIINRSPRLRRLCQHLDPMFLGLAVSDYVARNLQDGAAARTAQRDRGVPDDGDQHREAPRPGPDAAGDDPPAARHDPVVGWGAGVAPEEVAGLGVFQG